MNKGEIDKLSFTLGAIQNSVEELKSRAAEDRDLQEVRHAENQKAINDTKTALDGVKTELKAHVTTVQLIQPEVAALKVSRSRMAMLASVGLVVLYFVGRAAEIGFGWALEKLIKIKFGG